MVFNRTEIPNQMSFSPYRQREVSVFTELIFEQSRYCLTIVPPQPNSHPENVKDERKMKKRRGQRRTLLKTTSTPSLHSFLIQE